MKTSKARVCESAKSSHERLATFFGKMEGGKSYSTNAFGLLESGSLVRLFLCFRTSTRD